ncbi:hypothetical protein P3S67_021083 [Capsicum chacoense]
MDTEKEVERFQKLFDEGKNKTAYAMLMVGYEMENGEEFFLVQNSWGKKWGYYGFVKIKRSLLYDLQYPLIH